MSGLLIGTSVSANALCVQSFFILIFYDIIHICWVVLFSIKIYLNLIEKVDMVKFERLWTFSIEMQQFNSFNICVFVYN